jgi:hypothetical protein
MRNETDARRDTHLQSIDNAALTPLLRQASGSETVEVANWDCRGIHEGYGDGNLGGTAIHHVAGAGDDGGRTVHWSLILKLFQPPPDRGQPSDWNYWRREADAYRSGWLDDLPGRLAAPRCFGVVAYGDGTCWIWMKDIEDEFGPQWPLEYCGVVGSHLGQFNGAYLVGRPIPSHPWLGRDWLRGYVALSAGDMPQLRNSSGHPLGPAHMRCPTSG